MPSATIRKYYVLKKGTAPLKIRVVVWITVTNEHRLGRQLLHVDAPRHRIRTVGQRSGLQGRWKNVRCIGVGTSEGLAVVQCSPEEFADLVERPGIIPAPYSARYHWIAL